MIWLTNSTKSERSEIDTKLPETFPGLIMKSDIEESIVEIETWKDQHIFIIIDGTIPYSEDPSIIRIEKLSQVQAIYIVNRPNKNNLIQYSLSSKKMKNFNNWNDSEYLKNTIRQDIYDMISYQRMDGCITIYEPNENLNEQTFQFLQFQYLIEMILRMPDLDRIQAQIDMLNVTQSESFYIKRYEKYLFVFSIIKDLSFYG